MNKTIDNIPQETMSILCASEWPGNVRELENFIERAVMLTKGRTLRAPLSELEALQDETLQAAERKHILRILEATRWVIGGARGAANRLGLKRTTLNSKLRKLGIERDAYRKIDLRDDLVGASALKSTRSCSRTFNGKD
jgi:transcriptional regulator with GAF, ATPase, and Fis domain